MNKDGINTGIGIATFLGTAGVLGLLFTNAAAAGGMEMALLWFGCGILSMAITGIDHEILKRKSPENTANSGEAAILMPILFLAGPIGLVPIAGLTGYSISKSIFGANEPSPER